jgi:predicted RND superfamily exporter protein
MRFVGVGTDDMFLIYSAYRRTKASETTAERLANTFRICGSGITITSLTNVIAFLAGATTNFYGIRLFCFYTSKNKNYSFN